MRTSLSRLLLFVLASLSLLSIGAILWNSYRIQADVDEASWVELTARISTIAMRIDSIAALERGITTTAMADPVAGRQLLAEIQQERTLHEEYFGRLQGLQPHVEELQPEHPVLTIFRSLDEQHRALLRLRQRADTTLAGEAEAALEPQHWFDQLTIYISTLDTLRRTLYTPMATARERFGHHIMAEAILSRLMEHLGRERALVAAAIAQARPFSASDRDQLTHARAVVEEALQQLSVQLMLRLPDGELEAAVDLMKRELNEYFAGVRQRVNTAQASGTAYPLSAREWFHEATRAIDSVIALSDALTGHLGHDVSQIRRAAERSVTSLAVVIAIIIAAFGYTAHVIFRRVVAPLRQLQRSSHAISGGDLMTPITVNSGDELGHLGRSMEDMRRALLADRTQRETTERELRKLTHVLEQSVSAVVITDPSGIVEYVNPQYTRTTGYAADEVLGRKHNFLGSGSTPDHVCKALWNTISRGNIWEGELVNQKKDGTPYHNLVNISPVKNENGIITHFVGIQHDITQRRELESHLAHVATHDQLTGLPNRTLLGQRFDDACKHHKHDGCTLAVTVLNIRRFSAINENLGHQIGDQVLKEVARRLVEHTRFDDIVARFAADEFVLLLREPDTPETAASHVQRLIDRISIPIPIDGHTLNISFSAGISLCPHDGTNIDTLIANAESALAGAKQPHGSRIRYYTEELNDTAARRFRIESDLKRAISANELSLHFQPKVNLRTGHPVGVEALVRWAHPELGAVSPVEFIPIAEETGSIVELGSWVLTESCRTLKEWHRRLPNLTMGVNVCAYQLYADDFVDRVGAVIERFSLSPDCLEIEITESAVMDNLELMAERLKSLKRLGVRLAIDDFGTGYSSLAQLMRFPFDTLKVDREFVKDITTSPESAGLARLIVALGDHMKLQVVAEGAETEAQTCYLRQLGCEVMQGYYYSRPLPADEAFIHLTEARLTLPCCISQPASRALLLLDDEENVLRSLRRVLRHEDYQLLATTDPEEAFDLLAIHHPDVVLVDQRMPRMDGIEFLRQVKELHPNTVRMVLSGYTDINTVTKAVNRGHIFKFLTKPWNDEELRTTIAEAFEAHTGFAKSENG